MTVTGNDGRLVGSRAWLDLLHAETCWLLRQAGIDAMVLKGPATARWLYPDGGRPSVDVDLLVDPAGWDDAIAVLRAHGFTPVQREFRSDEPAPHSLELQRRDPAQGEQAVDLHRYFPGIEASPETAFAVLWARRVPDTVARIEVDLPDVTSRALVVALHAARTPASDRVGEDLRRATRALDLDGWREVVALAAQLDARPALRAGLETQPAGRALVDPLGLGEVAVPVHWKLLSTDADQTAVRLDELAHLPVSRRPGQVFRWAFPSPALVRAGDPRASRGPAWLAVAYLTRLGDGVRRLPKAYRQYRSTRR